MSTMNPNAELIGRIRSTPFYQTYEKAFRTATGLPLILISEQEEQFYPCDDQVNRNRFCKMLMEADDPCEVCIVTHHRVVADLRARDAACAQMPARELASGHRFRLVRHPRRSPAKALDASPADRSAKRILDPIEYSPTGPAHLR